MYPPILFYNHMKQEHYLVFPYQIYPLIHHKDVSTLFDQMAILAFISPCSMFIQVLPQFLMLPLML